MYHARLLWTFLCISAQGEMAYRANFFISLLYSLLNLLVGVVGLVVLFSQVQMVQGWNLASSFVLLGVYLMLDALNNLVIGPSFEGLAGLDGEIWKRRFDFTMLRPINTQFLASFRTWHIFSLIDLLLGVSVMGIGIVRLGDAITPARLLSFLIALIASIITVYAVLLLFTALVFWSPGFLFTWIFNGLFQMARYPVGFYPGWLRFALTWIVPVGIMTTIPVQALNGDVPIIALLGSIVFALALLFVASCLFQVGLRHYARS